MAIILNNHHTIKNCLNKPEFAGRPAMFPLDYFPKGNYGVVASTGPLWVEQRRFILRHMRELGMGKSSMEELIMNDVTFFLKDVTTNYADTGKESNIATTLNLAILSATWTILTGQKIGYKDDWFTRMSDNIAYALPEFLQKSAFVVFFPIFAKILPASWILTQNYIKSCAILHKYLDQVIEENKKTFDPNDIDNFVSIYLAELERKKSETGHYFSEWQVHALIGDMFVGGVETTPTSVRWALLLMAKHTKIQRKVQKEIDDLVGRERSVAQQDKYSLNYTEAVISEVQRYASVTPLGIIHEAVEDGNFEGYEIPKGTLLLQNLWANHRDERIWKYPWDFYPEHFLDKDGNYVSQEGFLPFSTGKRYCIGEGMARMELYLFFTNFLQKFEISLPPGVDIPMVSPKERNAVRGCPDYRIIIQSRK